MVSAFSGCFCLLTVALDGPKGVRMAIEGPSSFPQKMPRSLDKEIRCR